MEAFTRNDAMKARLLDALKTPDKKGGNTPLLVLLKKKKGKEKVANLVLKYFLNDGMSPQDFMFVKNKAGDTALDLAIREPAFSEVMKRLNEINISIPGGGGYSDDEEACVRVS